MSATRKLPPPPPSTGPGSSGSRSTGAQPRRSLSMRIGRIAGIEIRIHASFLILVALVALAATEKEGPTLASSTSWLVALFACVVAHELGHSLVARRNGIETVEIELAADRGHLEARPASQRTQGSSCASQSPARSSAWRSGSSSRSPRSQRGSRCGRRRSTAAGSSPGSRGSTCCSLPSTSCRLCPSTGVGCSVRCSSSTPIESGQHASRLVSLGWSRSR